MKLHLLFLFVFASITSNAQDFKFYHPHSGKYKVIAVSGLNLRAKPNTHSEIIKKIAYFQEVRILHKDDYGYEVIDSIITNQEAKYYSKGFWIKVSHEGSEGFLNTAYLYPVYNHEWIDKEENVNEDYILLRPGGGCRDNFIENLNAFHWYGLYRTVGSAHLKPVAFEYARSDRDMLETSIVAKDDKNLVFIVGSKKALKEGSIIEHMFEKNFYEHKKYEEPMEYNVYEDEYCLVRSEVKEFPRHTKEGIEKRYEPTYQFFVKKNGQTQFLVNMPYIDWIGDLDGDGQMDYISTKGEKDARTFLFLSSEETTKQLIKAVAVFYSGYCC